MFAQQSLSAKVYGEQRVTQVVPEHRDELFTQFGGATFFLQIGFGLLLAFFSFDLQRQHACKRLHSR